MKETPPKVVLAIAIVAVSAVQLNAQRDRYSVDEKRFGQVAKKAEKHLKVISVSNQRLKFELPPKNEAQKLARTLYGSSQSGGGGGSPGRWEYHMYDGHMSFRFAEGVDRLNPADSRARKFLAIEEKNFPFRSSMISEQVSHLELFTHSPTEQKIVWLRQGENGTTAVLISEGDAEHYSGRSLAELIAVHDMSSIAAEFRANCLPIGDLGSSDRIIDLVIELSLIDETKVDEIKQTWAELAADEFKTRDSALRRLKNHMPDRPAEIAFVLLNPQLFSVPLRAAFAEVVKEATEEASDDEDVSETEKKTLQKMENDKSAIRAVVEGKLHQVPYVLIRVLDRISATDSIYKDNRQLRTAVIKGLEASTKKQFGDDLGKWEAWQLEKISADSQSVAEDSEPNESAENGEDAEANARRQPAFSAFARSDLAKLLVITIDNNDRIRLDRQHWKETFQSKPAKEILRDIEQQMKEAGVPGSWVTIGNGYDWDYVDYPQMLFERFEFAMSSKMNPLSRFQSRSRRSYMGQKEKSFNREIEMGPVRGKLQMHPPQRSGDDMKAEYCFVEVFDASDNGELAIRLLEKESSSFSLVVKSGRSARLLVIGQNESGHCWIHLGQGPNLTSVSANSAKELFSNNKEWIVGDVARFSAEFGINFSEAFGGPLEVKNAERATEDENEDKRD